MQWLLGQGHTVVVDTRPRELTPTAASVPGSGLAIENERVLGTFAVDICLAQYLPEQLRITDLVLSPSTLTVDPRLARLWLARGVLALVPLPVAWLAVRGLDPGLAPSWLWLVAAATVVGLLLVTARLVRPEAS